MAIELPTDENPVVLINADCLDVLREFGDDTFDSIVTDPPYGLAFMGKDWDHGLPGVTFWEASLRVAKPGAHLLAFGGTRTFHRLTCAIEDAGWEIRDCVMWVYGSGFPKSLDVSKAIDKANGSDGEWVREDHPGRPGKRVRSLDGTYGDHQHIHSRPDNPDGLRHVYSPATAAAREWSGWGTALKPAWEPIIVARKPLIGTVAANVQQFGTGGINVDACRVGTTKRVPGSVSRTDSQRCYGEYGQENGDESGHNPSIGRWPANLIHDGSDEVLAGFPATESGGGDKGNKNPDLQWGSLHDRPWASVEYAVNFGSAARFFYTAKASSSERGKGNSHPTVKPLDLMRYLVRLVTRRDGLVLDLFAGSGTTLIAAVQEGCRAVGIEREAEYVAIAEKRLKEPLCEDGLFATASPSPPAAADLFPEATT